LSLKPTAKVSNTGVIRPWAIAAVVLIASASAAQNLAKPSEPSLPCQVKGELAKEHRKTIWFTSDEMKGRATKKVDVGSILKNADVNATVIVSIVVGTDGKVECLQTMNPKHPMVVGEVDKALSQWKFKPMEQDGKPVSYVGWLQFRFCRVGCAEGKSSVTLLN
jgi:Gram-negative bacterial TonB protein C-terminal